MSNSRPPNHTSDILQLAVSCDTATMGRSLTEKRLALTQEMKVRFFPSQLPCQRFTWLNPLPLTGGLTIRLGGDKMAMKSIDTILSEFGIEIPEDKKEEFRVIFHENYKTIKDYEKVSSDRDAWKEKAESAEATLQSFEGVDLETMKTELADWKQKAEEKEREYESKIYERDFSDAINKELEKINFTSESAKKAIALEIKESGLKLKEGKILGFSDLIDQIKERDSSAFLEDNETKPKFTGPIQTRRAPFSSVKDIMKEKDATKRQRAIAENIQLFD